MIIISPKELSQDTDKYLNMLPNEKVFIKQKNAFIELNYCNKLPEDEEIDDNLMTKEEFLAMVNERVSDYESGKSKAIPYTEELKKELFGDL